MPMACSICGMIKSYWPRSQSLADDWPFLPQQPRIIFQVTHVNLLALLNDFGMFLAHQPANVRKEESTLAVVWISIGIGEFVMDTMISCPVKNRLLCCHCLEEDEKKLKELVGFEGSVCEVTMGCYCRSEAGDDAVDPGDCNCWPVLGRQPEAVNGSSM